MFAVPLESILVLFGLFNVSISQLFSADHNPKVPTFYIKGLLRNRISNLVHSSNSGDDGLLPLLDTARNSAPNLNF